MNSELTRDHIVKLINILESNDHDSIMEYISNNKVDKNEYNYWMNCRNPLVFEYFKTDSCDLEQLIDEIISDDNVLMFRYLRKHYIPFHYKHIVEALTSDSIDIVKEILNSVEVYEYVLPFYENLNYETVSLLHEYKDKLSKLSVRTLVSHSIDCHFVDGTDFATLNLLSEMIIDKQIEQTIGMPIELCSILISKGVKQEVYCQWTIDYFDFIDNVNEEYFMKLISLIIQDFDELYFTHNLIREGFTNIINYIINETKFMIKFNLALCCNVRSNLLQKIKDKGRLQVFWEGDTIQRFSNDVQNVIKSLVKIEDLDEDLLNDSKNKILINM